jgi:hypothetical protein
MDVWVPKRLYYLLPGLCIVLAIIFYIMPPGFIKWVCIVYLVGYAGYVFIKRLTGPKNRVKN